MRELIKKRTLSPNNVASQTKRILKENGFEIPSGSKSRVIVNNKRYTLTTTGYKEDYPDARQYDTSSQGLVTLWLRDGNFYIYDRFNLNYGSTTREMGEKEFVQVVTSMKFENSNLLDTIPKMTGYKKIVTDGLDDAICEVREILNYITEKEI